MRSVRLLLLLMAILCVSPFAAQAQWATKIVEHDWRVNFGEKSFGLLQEQIDTGVKYRVTSICFGSYKITTGLRAVYVAALIVLPLGVAGFVAMTRPRGNKEA